MMKQIKLVDFIAEYKSIKKEIDTAFKRVLGSGWYVLGKEVENFENELSKFIGTKYAIGLASGTDALIIALKSLNLKVDDEVIIPANVYPTVFGVALSGVKIKLADVDPETLNISVETIRKSLTQKTKAIVVVHLYGNPADLRSIKNLAKEKGIYLIEDCAQAIGAEYDGKKIGTFGDISCFSFYPTKNLGAYGDAGAILTNNKKFYERAKLFRMYGERKRYESVLVGQNSRLDEIQAAILRVKLKYLDNWNKKRRKFADIYKTGLAGLPLKITRETDNAKSVYHLLVIQVSQRQKLIEFLKRKGIDTGIHYPVPIHLTKSFYYLGYKRGDFSVSEKLSRMVLSLPIHSLLKENDVKYVVSSIREFFMK